MAFDPDEYLNETGTSSTATAEFDPDAYLSETEEQEAAFDPDAYLAEVEAPTQPAPPVGTSFFEEVAAIPQALRQSIEQPTEAMGETAEVLGMPALGRTLRGAVEAPEGYVPAAQRFMEPQEGEFQIGGFAPQFLPRAIVEQAGQIGGAILTRAAGAAIGGLAGSTVGPKGTVAGAVAGSFLGPALFEMSQIVGPVARERAANQGREEPTTDDLAWAWSTAGASGALNAIGAKYLPNGDKLVGGLAKRISTAIAGEGTTEGLQNVVQQTGQTFLTESGFKLEPKETIGEAIIGGGAAGGAVVAAAPFTPTPEAKATAAADTKIAAEQAAPVAPETAQVVSEQANQVIAQAQAEETAETPDERVARLQREAQEAAGDIELEEEGAGLPPVEPTPPVTPTPEAAVVPVEPVVPEVVVEPPEGVGIAPPPPRQEFTDLINEDETSDDAYQRYQSQIDEIEDRLEAEGVDIVKLVDPTLAGAQNLIGQEGYTEMPPDLVEAYARREAVGAGQLAQSVGELTEALKNQNISEQDIKRVLDTYAIDVGKVDAFAQYKANEYTKAKVEAPPITQLERVAIALAAERGEMFDAVEDISKETLLDAGRAVKAIQDYFGVRPTEQQRTEFSRVSGVEFAALPPTPEAAPATVEPTPVTPPVTPQLEPLRRVARAEQTEEDVAGLVDSGFAEVYKGQPVLTQAGLDALPEAERPRLTPEARKIQIDTGANDVAAEAISKNLRIGVDQIDPNVRMPAGWTLVGDVYVPPTRMEKIEDFEIDTTDMSDQQADVFRDIIQKRQQAENAVINKPVGQGFNNLDEFRAAFDLRGQGHSRFSIRLDLMVEDGALTEDAKNLILATIWDNNTSDELLGQIEMGTARRGQIMLGYGGRKRQQVLGLGGKPAIGYKPFFNLLRQRRTTDPSDKRTADILSTFWHEYGHMGYYSLLNDAQKKEIAKIYNKTSRQERRDFFARGTAAARDLKYYSQYYAKSETEWFAQSFAEYVIKEKSDHKSLVPIFEQILDKIKAVFGKLFGRKDTVNLNDIYDFILRGESLGKAPTWDGITMSKSPPIYGTTKAQAIDPAFTRRLQERERAAGIQTLSPQEQLALQKSKIKSGINLRWMPSVNEYGNSQLNTEYSFSDPSLPVDKIEFRIEQFRPAPSLGQKNERFYVRYDAFKNGRKTQIIFRPIQITGGSFATKDEAQNAALDSIADVIANNSTPTGGAAPQARPTRPAPTPEVTPKPINVDATGKPILNWEKKRMGRDSWQEATYEFNNPALPVDKIKFQIEYSGPQFGGYYIRWEAFKDGKRVDIEFKEINQPKSSEGYRYPAARTSVVAKELVINAVSGLISSGQYDLATLSTIRGASAFDALELIAKTTGEYSKLAQEILNAAKIDSEIMGSLTVTMFRRKRDSENKGRLKNRSYYSPSWRSIYMMDKDAGDARVVVHEVIHGLLVQKLPADLGTKGVKGAKYKKALDSALKSTTTPEPLKDIIRGYILAAEAMGATETLWGEGPLRGTYSQTIYKSSKYLGVVGREAKTKAQREGGRMFEVEGMTTVKRVLQYLKENGITEVDVVRRGAKQYDVTVAQSDLEKIETPKEKRQKFGARGYDPDQGYLSWIVRERKPPIANRPDTVVDYGFEYGLGNLDEFLAEAFSSPKFQGILNDIQMESGRTVWQTIVDAIRRILGMSVKQGSVLDVISRSAIDLATTPDVLMLNGKTAPSAAPTPEIREARIEPTKPITELHKIIDSGYWGASNTMSKAMTGLAANLMDVGGFSYGEIERRALPAEAKRDTRKILQAINDDTITSPHVLFSGFFDRNKTQWSVGQTTKIPLAAATGDLGVSGSYANGEGDGIPTIVRFPIGTKMAAYARGGDENFLTIDDYNEILRDGEYIYDQAIVSGEFRITGIEKRSLYEGAEPVTIVSVEQVATFDPRSKTFQPVEVVREARIERDPEVQKAAQDLRAGTINRDEYQRIVDMRMPLRKFEAVPTPATNDDMLRGLGERTIKRKDAAGNDVVIKKTDIIQSPESIAEGTVLEARLDIPAYESENVWVVSLHRPRPDLQKGAAAQVVAYTPTSVLRNVTFGVTEKAAAGIAAGKPKSTIATMRGEYVPMTAEQAYQLANTNKEQWVEIGMNPVRHSYFYDKDTQTPVESAEEVVQVGGMVLAKNPVFGKREDYLYARRVEMGRAGMEQSAVEARLQELGFPTGGIIRVVNQPDADFEGRTIILDGKVTGIELNAAAMRDNATIDRVLNHEFAESANADGALNRLVERLTPKEKKEINDTITRLRYEERARSAEEAARAIETLAEAWKGRGFFTRAVARVEAWASKLGFKLTRRAAEYIAARNLADINAGFRTAYNRFINVKGEAREGRAFVTPEENARFLELAKDPEANREELQRMVDEVMQSLGATPTQGTRVYRGSVAITGEAGGAGVGSTLGSGVYVTANREAEDRLAALDYAGGKFTRGADGNIQEFLADLDNAFILDTDKRYDLEDLIADERLKPWFRNRLQSWLDNGWYSNGLTGGNIVALIQGPPKGHGKKADIGKAGFDAVVTFQDGEVYEAAVTNPEILKPVETVLTREGVPQRGVQGRLVQLPSGEIKSADPVTYDDQGNVIPLEQRFQPTTTDIRYARREVRESRREPEAIPTFTEGTPEAATLKEMEASMAKVDAASEAKGGKPETYKISEIASVWMDSGLGERELQDAIVEYTNLTPANAAKVAKAIARQYDIQQSIATAFLETSTGLSVEAIPEGATLPPEVDPDRPKPVMVRLFETYMGVKVPPTKLTVNEKTALRDQIRLKAAANREAKKAQQATQSEVIDIIKAMELRGPVRPKQAAALAKRAAKVIWTSEKSMEAFVNYAEKVVINTNYDADLREAKAAQKRAQQLSKSEKVAAPQREVLADIAKIGVNMLDNPAEFAVAVNHYLRGFKSVVSPDYVVIPDAEITSYLSAMQTEADANKAEFDRATNERLAIKYGIPLNELEKYLNAENIIRDLASYARREVVEGILTEKAQEMLAGLKAYDQTPLRDEQRKILDEMVKFDPRNLDSEERQRFVRIGNNIIFNNQTNGAEYFVATAKGQQMAREMAKDETAIAKNKAWVNLLPSIVSPKLQRGWALELQSVADTFRNAFGKGAMGKVYRMMGMLDLNMAQTKANTQLDQIQEEISAFYNGLEKKYKAAARNQDGILAEGVVGFLIQKVPEKGETESLAQRRNLIQQDIRNRREDGDQDRAEMANRIEALLQQLDGATVQDILNNLKQNYRPNYDSLMFLKNTLFPKYKEFLKRFDENFNDQANNYENPDYLPIGFVRAGPSLAITEEETGQFYDHVSLRPKQSSYTIKRADYTQLPTDQSTGTPKEIEFNLRRNAFDSLSDQITKAYTNPAWQRINAFLKTPESIEVFGGRANRDFFIERLNRLRLSRMRRGALSRGYIEKTADVVSVIARKLGTGIALGGVYQTFKQAPDQLITTLATTGRRDLLGKNAMDVLAQQLAPKTLRESTKMLNKFSIGRRGDASAGYKYINQMEGAQTRMERYFTESKWDQAKEQGSKIADIWMVALKKSDFVAAAGSWLTYYRADLAKRGIKFEGWEREAELVDTDPARQDAAAYAEQMTDIYQGSSDPTQMATFAQSGKSGWENLWKSMFVPFNSFAVQQRMRLYSDARDALTKTGVDQKTGYLGLSGTIGGMILFHMVKRLFIPVLSGAGVGVLYGVMGVDVEEPDEEKKKEDLNKRWRQMQGEILANMLVGGTGQIIEAKTIDAFNYAAYLISVQTENESVLDDNGEVMPFSTYVKERSPFWRYQAFDSAYSLGMLEIGLGQAEKAVTQSKMLMDSEEMENFTPEEQRLLYFAAVSEWLYTMRLNDADFARLVDKARRDMIKAVKDREKELQRIRSGR